MKRILIISPGPFSPSDNDGQTLEDLFQLWDKEKMAQLFIQDIGADFNFCHNYYRVTDRGALKYLLRQKYNPIPIPKTESSSNYGSNRLFPKNSLTLLMRNMLWRFSPWYKKGAVDWIKKYSPEVIFFEVGDNVYMIDFVVRLRKMLSIPLIVHNTEGFYFFKEPYFKHPSFAENLLYPLFHKRLVKAYSRLMEYTDYVMYSCEKLCKEFSEIYKNQSCVIYKTANFPTVKRKKTKTESLTISYVGNLSFNRPAALIEIADFLKEYHSELKIDVYGKAQSNEECTALTSHPNVNYHGFVHYSSASKVVANSDILLHIESKLSEREVAYGFSTKIPLSLASGNCFFMYAPQSVAGQDYMMSYIPLAAASSNDEMRKKLHDILTNPSIRAKIVSDELELANRNHNKETILANIKDIINGL